MKFSNSKSVIQIALEDQYHVQSTIVFSAALLVDNIHCKL